MPTLRNRLIGAILICSGAMPLFPAAQPTGTVPDQDQPDLQILVIGGEGSINNVKQRTAREPVVEVRDRNNRPVAGAAVLFEAPRDGASGTFTGGSTSLRVTADAQGHAVGQGFRPNSTTGDFAIQVTVTAGTLRAVTAIHMRNVVGAALPGAKGGLLHHKLFWTAVAAGAGAAAGAIVATRGGSAPPPPTPTLSISVGAGSVGPHP